MTKLEEEFGAMVRYHRKRAGLSQAQLAERIDRQTNAVQRLEAGETAPTFDTVERLSSALNVPIREFFGTSDYALGAGKDDPLAAIFKQLVDLSQDDLLQVQEIVTSALRLRK